MPRYTYQLDLAVAGADKLAKLAARLKEQGELEMRRRMLKQLREGARVLRDAERQAITDLPARKYERGLRRAIAAATTTETRTSSARAGVRVMVNRRKVEAFDPTAGRLPVLMNKGRWRHPVNARKDADPFNNRSWSQQRGRWVHQYGGGWKWVEQTTEGGFWDRTVAEHRGDLQERMLAVLRETADAITKE